MIKDTKKILSHVKRLYWNWGWVGVYTYWRFWEYPRYLKMDMGFLPILLPPVVQKEKLLPWNLTKIKFGLPIKDFPM